MRLKSLVCMFFFGLLGAAHAAEQSFEYPKGVRFDLHQHEGGVQLIGRAQPGTSLDTLERAFNARALQICPGAIVSKQQSGTYWHAVGGGQYMMPAGGIFIAMNKPNSVEPAPILRAAVGCPTSPTSAAPGHLRLAVVPRLGSVVSYVDQGFASFNRGKLDVVVAGPSFDEVAGAALIDALRERGYDVELVPSTDETATRIEIAPASNPGESFDGLVLMTKIGMLGIDNASYAFCSFRIDMVKAKTPPQLLQKFNTRDRIEPIYANWDRDMKNGPSTDVHRAVYDRLSSTLDHDIKAAIHALPTTTLELLAQVPPAPLKMNGQ